MEKVLICAGMFLASFLSAYTATFPTVPQDLSAWFGFVSAVTGVIASATLILILMDGFKE